MKSLIARFDAWLDSDGLLPTIVGTVVFAIEFLVIVFAIVE